METLMVDTEQMQRVTVAVWDAVLRLPLELNETSVPVGRQSLSGCAHITGAWNGAVVLTCDVGLALTATTIMFGMAQAEVAVSDIQDCMGELVNMVAGNVKAFFPQGCQLSLPSVVEGSDHSTRVPGSKMIANLPMRCGTHCLNVRLLQKIA
jgi:CheY-specific phosphatase CheX